MSVAAVILAAGFSHRFRSDKRGLRVHDGSMSMLNCIRTQIDGIFDSVVLVVRSGEAIKMSPLMNEHIIEAPKAPVGMGESLAEAAKVLGDFDAVAVVLADMPFIQNETIKLLCAQASPGVIVVPTVQDRRGHPVVIGSDFFDDLKSLSGDTGARALLRTYSSAVRLVDVADSGIIQDIDTPSDLENYANMIK